ncbi:MAG: inorganic phosphate transporter [Deltaproteobacteria bacterium]|nr:inorganic phosphate transporter [Deltaproteobacteria bacterium]
METGDLSGITALAHAPPIVLFLILVALLFDFINGFHDAANSIATVVSTRVLSPRIAVWWAATFNFLAVFVFGTAVAKTIGKGIIDISIIDYSVMFSALAGAIIWNMLTWYFGIPSSSSHALIGGLVGAGIAKTGIGSLVWSGINKTLIFIVVAPLLGLVLGFVYMVALFWIFHRATPYRVDHLFRRGQLLSAALYSLGHGGNDAQKTAGIIFGVLAAAGMTKGDHIPFWVLMLCHIAIALGTAFGGWRIVKTMGMRITQLKPVGGFAAEAAGATTLAINSVFGIPASTTHVITGAIVGVGTVTKPSSVRWSVAGTIIWAWILTIPASALISVLTWWALRLADLA